MGAAATAANGTNYATVAVVPTSERAGTAARAGVAGTSPRDPARAHARHQHAKSVESRGWPGPGLLSASSSQVR
jgi:hypothetical protein